MSSTAIYFIFQTIFISSILLATGIIDFKKSKIPNVLVLILFLGWVLFTCIDFILCSLGILYLGPDDSFARLVKSIVEAGALVFVFACLFIIFNKVGNIDKDKIYFGLGDVKLLTVLCLFVGLKNLLIVLVAACVFFLLFVFLRYLITKNKDNKAPFAPSIFFGYLIFVVWYLSKIG